MPVRQEMVTTIDLLRHGACEGGEVYRGRTDTLLSTEGWQQMELAIGSHADWQRIVTSPLSRCRRFAEHCASEMGLPLRVVAAMREIDFGDWEGRLLEEVWRETPEQVDRFYRDPSEVTPPGGEPVVAALERIVASWRELMEECAGEHLLLVSHGGVIRLLLSHLLDLPLSNITRLHIPYASRTRIRVHHLDQGDFPVLLSLNSGSHACD